LTRIAKHQIDFEPVGRRGRCPADRSLLDSARQKGYLELASEPSSTQTLL
jgi:uncharacterized 2Fe-2S/4Fe-4S cluster protein (DUF4445 family)